MSKENGEHRGNLPLLPCGCSGSTRQWKAPTSGCVKLQGNRRVCIAHGRFSCDAESCCSPGDTHEAITALCSELRIAPIPCPGGWCPDRKEKG